MNQLAGLFFKKEHARSSWFTVSCMLLAIILVVYGVLTETTIWFYSFPFAVLSFLVIIRRGLWGWLLPCLLIIALPVIAIAFTGY